MVWGIHGGGLLPGLQPGGDEVAKVGFQGCGVPLEQVLDLPPRDRSIGQQDGCQVLEGRVLTGIHAAVGEAQTAAPRERAVAAGRGVDQLETGLGARRVVPDDEIGVAGLEPAAAEPRFLADMLEFTKHVWGWC